MKKIVILNGYIERNKDIFMDKIDIIEEEFIKIKIDDMTKEIATIIGKYMDYTMIKGKDYANKYIKENFNIDDFLYFDDLLDMKYNQLNCNIDAVYIKDYDCIAFTLNMQDKSFINLLDNKFVKCEYWNNIMKPQEIDEYDWSIRKDIWEEFSFSKKVNIKIFGKEIVDKIDEELVFKMIKTNYNSRILDLAKELVTAEYIEKNPDLLVNNKAGYFKTIQFKYDIEYKIKELKTIIKK